MAKSGLSTLADRMLQIDAIVRQLDVSLRERATEILAQASQEEAPAAEAAVPACVGGVAEATAGLDFFSVRYGSKIPAENVLVLVAWLRQRGGVKVFSARAVRDFAGLTGLCIPQRPDSTMRYASVHGQSLFARTPPGWCLTSFGEAHLLARYPA